MKYLFNDLHDLAWRLDGETAYSKKKGGAEVLSAREADGKMSKSLTDALIENHEISKAEYDAY